MVDLTDVDGIGDGNIDAIRDCGIDSVSDLATADVETVAEAKGFGESSAESVIEGAQELMSTEAGPEPDQDAIESIPDDIGYPPSGETATLTEPFSFRARMHAIAGLIERSEQHQQQRRHDEKEAAQRAMAAFMVEQEPTLDKSAWHESKHSLVEQERTWRGISRLNGIQAELRGLKTDVQELWDSLGDDAS